MNTLVLIKRMEKRNKIAEAAHEMANRALNGTTGEYEIALHNFYKVLDEILPIK